jgi:hypothetical protein
MSHGGAGRNVGRADGQGASGQCAATELAIKTTPIARKTTPMTRLNRDVVG